MIKDKRMKKILNKLGISFTRQDAVYGRELEIQIERPYCSTFWCSPSQMSVEFWSNRSNFKTMTKYKSSLLPKGAFLSHTLALKKAEHMGLDKVLILEDDIDPQTNIHNTFTIPKNTDIFYLGGSFEKRMILSIQKNPIFPLMVIFKNGRRICLSQFLPERKSLKYIMYSCQFLIKEKHMINTKMEIRSSKNESTGH